MIFKFGRHVPKISIRVESTQYPAQWADRAYAAEYFNKSGASRQRKCRSILIVVLIFQDRRHGQEAGRAVQGVRRQGEREALRRRLLRRLPGLLQEEHQETGGNVRIRISIFQSDSSRLAAMPVIHRNIEASRVKAIAVDGWGQSVGMGRAAGIKLLSPDKRTSAMKRSEAVRSSRVNPRTQINWRDCFDRRRKKRRGRPVQDRKCILILTEMKTEENPMTNIVRSHFTFVSLTQEPGLRVQGERQVHRGRDPAQPVPVVQVQEVSRRQHEERRSE